MRIGTVGTNVIVDNFISAAKDTGKIEIAAVYSRSAEKGNAFADKYGVEKRYTDKKEFLSDSNLDFIYVASPNSLHYEWTKAALEAGRNVICEKPFVTTEKEAREICELAKAKGLFLFEAITVYHLPNYRLLKEHIAELGALKLVQLNFSQYSSRYDAYLRGENPNVFNPEFSGGALMDLNYYNLNFVYGLFGEPQEIKYFANIADNGVDTSGVLILRYPGFVVTAASCKDSKSENFTQIQGEKGYIYVPNVSSRCISFTVHTGGSAEEYNEQKNDNALYYELCDFLDIWGSGDYARRDAMMERSVKVTALVEKARHDAGVIFPADKK